MFLHFSQNDRIMVHPFVPMFNPCLTPYRQFYKIIHWEKLVNRCSTGKNPPGAERHKGACGNDPGLGRSPEQAVNPFGILNGYLLDMAELAGQAVQRVAKESDLTEVT